MRLTNILIMFITCCLAACSYTPVPVDTTNLDQLQQLSTNTVKRPTTGMSAMRSEALEEAAMSLGAQAGLAWRSGQINVLLDNHAKTLDRVFSFNGLLLAHNVLPPVLEEGRDTLNLADTATIRLSDRTYKIVQQAQFVTTAPNWRTYLWMGYSKPAPPDQSFLPRTKQEDQVWRNYVVIGWQKGVKQADIIYTENLSRLRRDIQGMLLYRKMLSENMVSAPFVAKTDLGVTNEHGEMRVNDQVLRITALPDLQSNSATWNPIVVKDHDH